MIKSEKDLAWKTQLIAHSLMIAEESHASLAAIFKQQAEKLQKEVDAYLEANPVKKKRKKNGQRKKHKR